VIWNESRDTGERRNDMPRNEEIIKALKFAIELEKMGLKTYLDLAKKTADDTGKSMFIWLAGEEFEHMRLLEDLLEKEAAHMPIGKLKVEEKKLSELVPRLKGMEKRKSTRRAEAHQIDALKAALEQEKKSRDFYREQAQKAEHPEVKQLFETLAEMEQAHYDLIQAQLDFIRGTGFWFGIPEFSVEGRS